MEKDLSRPEKFAQRVIQLYGGLERCRAHMDERFNMLNAIWDQDNGSIGRVLRTHLAVEHFLKQYLVTMNPLLGSVEKARLRYLQMVELLPNDDPSISFLKPGLRRINEIRNRLAHRLHVDITEEDKRVFKDIHEFWALREELAKGDGQEPDDPLSVMEHFARFASGFLHNRTDPNWHLYQQAITEVYQDDQHSPE